MGDANTLQEESPLVCLLSEDDAGRAEEEARARLIMAKAERIDEVADGYAFRIPAPNAMLDTIAEFLAFERWCCPFITFELDLAPNQGPLTLRMRGPAAFKDFLREEIAAHLGMDITAAAVSGVGAR